jgi:hypothetical protein
VTDAATKLPAAGGYRPLRNTIGRARCPQCGLISLDSGRCQFVVRHCPRCVTGRLQPVEMPELNQPTAVIVTADHPNGGAAADAHGCGGGSRRGACHLRSPASAI